MPGTTVLEEIEITLEDWGGGGEPPLVPPPKGGDGGGDAGKGQPRGGSVSRRYLIAIRLLMVSIFVFFVGLSVAFILLQEFSAVWVPVHLPRILWANTVILLASSVTLELARRSLAHFNVPRFQMFWRITTALGLLFVAGQVLAWWELVQAHVFLGSQRASFFYLFTAAHGVHLVGGICALLYVSLRSFNGAKISRNVASQVVSYYWHFMDGLWILLFALLYFGR